MEFHVPWRKSAEIEAAADTFLARHHATLAIPIPGLQRACDVDAFPYSDLSAIGVDEDVLVSRENRYRFSLAHELGHVELHAEQYRAGGWTDIETWKIWIRDVPEDVYRALEWQANGFAGALLMPRAVLRAEIATCRQLIATIAPALEQEDPDQHEAYVAGCIAKRFLVSEQSARIRISRLRSDRN